MAAVFDSEFFSLYLAGQGPIFFELCWVYHSRVDTYGYSGTNVQPGSSGIITNNRPLGGPQNVEVTGNFDDWSRSLKALKLDSGQFTATVKVPKRQKLVFKFVINDADWEVSGDYKIEKDENGIENNYVDASELVEDTESVASSSGKAAPVSKSGTDGTEGLTQTSTTESSFAAVSSSATVPESYEEVQSQESPALVEHGDMGVSMETPTNSLDNSALLQDTTTNRKNSTTKIQDHEKIPSASDSHVQDSEYHSVDHHRVPGSFPSTPPRGGSTRSQESSSVKKEGFMSKLKSMFR